MTATSVLALQSQAENTKSQGTDAEGKTEKCHMRCRPTARTLKDCKELFGHSRIVLRGGKLYVQLSEYDGPPLHLFSGYYLPYPDFNFEGLVSTVLRNPPQLNWIYLNTESLQIGHGLRAEAEKGLTGSWGIRVCCDGEKRFLFEKCEGFIAVEDEPGLWGLCFDRYNDGLKGRIDEGYRTTEIELVREEMEA
jgi:hypothetical protein